ncbi:MAG: DUF72 domain-containing protein [Myxococcales bacterium]|nr:DUF72 domain-containing protein [Myxococcales bacterium]
MRILTGTSGFSYPAWKGSFYPEKLPAKKMLASYASQLLAVEINNTFYRMPKSAELAAWAEQTPETFRFALKAPRRITHIRRLVDAQDDVAYFAQASSALGKRLGPVLFQLPPFLKCDVRRLQEFLDTLGGQAPELAAAFEFRHESWFVDEVFDALAARNAALCVADGDGLTTPLVATTSWGYLRLRKEGYAAEDLARWSAQTRTQPWSETYVFFKHEDAGVGPGLARAFLAAT